VAPGRESRLFRLPRNSLFLVISAWHLAFFPWCLVPSWGQRHTPRFSLGAVPFKGGRSRWLFYLLRCRDNSLYTGITNDLAKRLKAHAAIKKLRRAEKERLMADSKTAAGRG
jgi:GIY-YIG catalytic domain